MKKENNLSRRAFSSTGAVVATGAAASGFNIKDSNKASLPSVEEEELEASTYNSKTGHGSWTDAVHTGERSSNPSFPIYQGTTNPSYPLLMSGFIEKERRGIPENYYRLSVGIEDPDDLIADFKKTLEKI